MAMKRKRAAHKDERLVWYGWNRGGPFTPGRLAGHPYRTKRECADAMEAEYGYIRNRPDLQRYPHCWRVPKPVRCRVVVTTLKPVAGIIRK